MALGIIELKNNIKKNYIHEILAANVLDLQVLHLRWYGQRTRPRLGTDRQNAKLDGPVLLGHVQPNSRLIAHTLDQARILVVHLQEKVLEAIGRA